ncbi:hypothetical protein BKA81DRAFT_354277 [Phyllosticta paracitricarpa]|uniref:Secreted protein n=2 Tax=Phyllosticta TaxID=121621 RepID=A0ABR1ME62_9PEZI
MMWAVHRPRPSAAEVIRGTLHLLSCAFCGCCHCQPPTAPFGRLDCCSSFRLGLVASGLDCPLDHPITTIFDCRRGTKGASAAARSVVKKPTCGVAVRFAPTTATKTSGQAPQKTSKEANRPSALARAPLVPQPTTPLQYEAVQIGPVHACRLRLLQAAASHTALA